MANFKIKNGVAIIPQGTKKIADNAFYGCTLLTNIVIPEGVKEIGSGAFYGCTNLKSVTMPTKVLKINEGAFAGCTSLACITIPTPPKNKGACKIAERVFEDCCGLKSITIPDKVTSIGRCAFAGCTGLDNITIPSSVTEIGDGAFYGCTGLKTVTFDGNSLEKIGRCAFNGCTKLHITIPSSVREIGRYAFEGCANISIPAGVKVEGAPIYSHPYTTTIVSRLEQDLKDLYNNGNGIGEIQGAKTLNGIIATQPGQTSFATKAIPSYGGGKCGAKTVMVMLNPGEDVAKANANLKRDLCKRGMKNLLDINAYNEFNAHYGDWDYNRHDNFDLKQAFFLRDWVNSGVGLSQDNLNYIIKNNKTEKKEVKEEVQKLKLEEKRKVLMNKQQLELIPYASRSFSSFAEKGKTKEDNIKKLCSYVETLLHEIFSQPREYVIFCSGLFNEVFEVYNKESAKKYRVEFGKECKYSIIGEKLDKKTGKKKIFSTSCTPITIFNLEDKSSIKAIIANTFPSQALPNAYEKMAEYGKFCHEVYASYNKFQGPINKFKDQEYQNILDAMTRWKSSNQP